MGRILYSILEHAYWTREQDEQRAVLSLPSAIAPVKVSVLPLQQDKELFEFIPQLTTDLTFHGLSHKVDENGSVGKRYARMDEIGIPFAITIDFDTASTTSITLRERDSTNQVYVKLNEVASLIQQLIQGKLTWQNVVAKYENVKPK